MYGATRCEDGMNIKGSRCKYVDTKSCLFLMPCLSEWYNKQGFLDVINLPKVCYACCHKV